MSPSPQADAAGGPGPSLARSLLDLAAEVEAAERSIKAALLAAIKAGDSAAAERIITRWLTLPPAEVLEKRLDP